MARQIPLRSDEPDYTFEVELDGKTYGFRARWNFRSERWAFDFFDEDGVLLVANVGAVVDFPVGKRITKQGMPPGYLIFVDTTGKQLDPGRDDLGERVQLFYYSASEIE